METCCAICSLIDCGSCCETCGRLCVAIPHCLCEQRPRCCDCSTPGKHEFELIPTEPHLVEMSREIEF